MSEKTLQSLSGLYFGAFATLHLLNHSSFLVGDNVGKVARHKVAMDALRRVYQHPLAEGILALSVTIHGFIAIREYQRRNFPEGSEKDDNKTWAQFLGNRKKLLSSQNLHRLTGWVLMLQVPVHVFSTRIDQYLHGLTDGDVQAVVMAVRALPTAMLPYLVVLGSFGAYHLISGGVRAVNQLSGRLMVKQQGSSYALVTSIAGLVGTAIALAVSGVSLPPLLDFYFPIGPPELLKSYSHWPGFITQTLIVGFDDVLSGTRRWGGLDLYFFKIAL